jgi:thiol-disulfide isomerase/thioredoxin
MKLYDVKNSMLKKTLSNITYLALMLGLGFAIYYYILSPKTVFSNISSNYSQLRTQPLFSSKLSDPNGMLEDLSQYKGKIIVLNFWATWCPPCRDEMPELSKLSSEYKNNNVEVLGIAIDELALVKKFSEESPVSYPIFVAEKEGMELAQKLGNDKGVLPYTVIINQNGAIINTYFGRINKNLLESSLHPLIKH